MPAAPSWYEAYYKKAESYRYIEARFGLSLPYLGGARDDATWVKWTTEPADSDEKEEAAAERDQRRGVAAYVRGHNTIYPKHPLTSMGELDRWLGAAALPLERPSEASRKSWPRDPEPIKLRVSVAREGPKLPPDKLAPLDQYSRRRNTKAAGVQSRERQSVRLETVARPYQCQRAEAGSAFSQAWEATTTTDRMRAAAVVMADVDCLYVQPELLGTASDRDFTSSGWSDRCTALLRDRDNVMPVHLADDDGRMFVDDDFNRVRGLWQKDFAAIRQAAESGTYRRLMLPETALGTVGKLTGMHVSSPKLFQLLMYHLVTLLKGSSNAAESTVLDVFGRGYREFRGLRSEDACPPKPLAGAKRTALSARRGRLGSDPRWARDFAEVGLEIQGDQLRFVDAMKPRQGGAGPRVGPDESQREVAAAVRSVRMNAAGPLVRECTDGRLAWAVREVLARFPARVGTTDRPEACCRAGQFPTFTAPLSLKGLAAYQAGPITAGKVSNTEAKVMWDSGCTSDFGAAPWVLVQPGFVEKLGLTVDTTAQFRVAAVDGARVNTVGTAQIILQFPKQAPKVVEARVLHMESPELFDVLVGHAFMVENRISLHHGEEPMGVKFLDGTVLEYAAKWDPAAADANKLFTTRVDVRDERSWEPVGEEGAGAPLGKPAARAENFNDGFRSTSSIARAVSPLRSRKARVRVAELKAGNQKEKEECARLKRELRDSYKDWRPGELGKGDGDACDIDDGGGRGERRTPYKYKHGEVWRPPDAMRTEEMRSSPYDEIEFLDGPGGNQESAYGAETEQYLRSHRDFTKEDAEGFRIDKLGVRMFYFEDVPDEERLDTETDQKHTNAAWVAASLQIERTMPKHRRIVTRLMRTDPTVAMGGEMDVAAYIRKVQGYAGAEDKRAFGEWAQEIAPARVTAAMKAPCHEKIQVMITKDDGTSKLETWGVEAVKSDLLDYETGKLLGPAVTVEGVALASRRQIFNDQDPGRMVTSESPLTVKIKPEYLDGSRKPWFEYRRVPPALRSVLEAWVQDSIAKGIILPYRSSYASPIFCVPKAKRDPLTTEAEEATKYRIVVDLRQCNQATVDEHYPSPSCTEVFDAVTSDKKVYSSHDLSGAFHQQKVSEDLYPYLAFMTHGITVPETNVDLADGTKMHTKAGHYTQWTYARVPMGAQWSPKCFQASIDRTLQRHCGTMTGDEIHCFVDDLLISTHDHQRHWEVLSTLYTGLAADGWTLSRAKSQFFTKAVQFLGLVISCENEEKETRLYGDASKVQVVLDLPEPTDVTGLRGFLGCCNYYRNFIKGYSQIADPLVLLTKKGTKLRGPEGEWGPEHTKAFVALKHALATAGAVTPFDPRRETVIQIDACRTGAGACLMQVYNDHLRPCSFWSKTYREGSWKWKGSDAPETGEGSNKPSQLLELRAVVECMLHYRRYLDGSAFGLRILSDHSSLTSLKSMAARGLFTPQVQRWTQFLAGYEAAIQWRAGKTMHVADYLSRYAHRETGMKDADELMQDMTYDAKDVSAYSEEDLDAASYHSADKLLAGTPLRDVLPIRCPKEDRIFKGNDIGTFLRLTRLCYNTGTEDVGAETAEFVKLGLGGSREEDEEELFDSAFERDAGGHVRGVAQRGEGTSPMRCFRNSWEPAGLSALRENLVYDADTTEGKVHRVLTQGLSDNAAEELGVGHAKEMYNLNQRDELEVYDPRYGYALVVPSSRADVFRALTQYHHSLDHSGPDQSVRELRHRFYWRSPEDMKRTVTEVCGQCPECQARKRSTKKAFHVASPLENGGRPFEVISVDPKPMDIADLDTGYDSLLVCVDRWSGMTVAIPHYKTDTAEELGRLLNRHVFDVYGAPRLLLSDHDQKFASKMFRGAMESAGCRLGLGTPYHHRTSGAVEGRIKGLTDALNLRCHETGGQHWVQELSRALYSVNSKSGTEGMSPFELLYGYRPLSAVDFLRPDMDYDRAGWDFDEALHTYLSKRDDARGEHGDRLRRRREKAEEKGASDNPIRPAMGVGGWVMLHKQAFGPRLKESKLVGREAYGPFRVLELLDRGRIRVQLDNHYTQAQGDVFTLQHVRRFFQKRPWNQDQISLAEHMAAPWADGAEYEVDKVEGRRFVHNQYKYSVSYKGRTADNSRYLKREDPRFEGCQRLLEEYDVTYPPGVLPKDKPEDRRRYLAAHKETRKSGRLSNRRVEVSAEAAKERSRLVQRQTKAQKNARREAVVTRRTAAPEGAKDHNGGKGHIPGYPGPVFPLGAHIAPRSATGVASERAGRTYAADDVRHPQHPRQGGAVQGTTPVVEVLGVDVRVAGGVRIVVETLPFFEGSGDPYSWLSNHFVHAVPWEFRVPAAIVDLVASERYAESTGQLRHALRASVAGRGFAAAWFPFKGPVRVPSAEVAVMLCKAAVFRDEVAWEALCLQPNPDTAKRIGREVGIQPGGWWVRDGAQTQSARGGRGARANQARSLGGAAQPGDRYVRPKHETKRGGCLEWCEARWRKFREIVAGAVVDQKFDAEPRLARQLCATDGRYLVETNPKDKVWGAGMGREDVRLPFVDTEKSRGGWPYPFQECNLLGRRLMYTRARLQAAVPGAPVRECANPRCDKSALAEPCDRHPGRLKQCCSDACAKSGEEACGDRGRSWRRGGAT